MSVPALAPTWRICAEQRTSSLSNPDAAMRRKLAQRAAQAHVAVDVSDAAAEALPFPAEQFDAVLFTLVLCTVSDPEGALAEAHRVLKPTGQLVAIEHVRGTGRLARWQDKITPLWRHLVPRLPPEPRHPRERATGRIPLDQHRELPAHAHVDTSEPDAAGHRREGSCRLGPTVK